MSSGGQSTTRHTYEDPAVVRAFLDKNGEPRHGVDHIWEPLRDFADRVTTSPLPSPPGRKQSKGRILDISCGPGIHARQFARLGFDVVAVDYSQTMIDAATGFGEHQSIEYRQLDMREIGPAFEEGSFDRAWASASMIHVPEVDIPSVLAGIRTVLKPGGLFHVSLKGGRQGAEMVVDDKYGLITKREFVFWEEENFWRLLREEGFVVENVRLEQGGVTGTKRTSWLNFVARAGGSTA